MKKFLFFVALITLVVIGASKAGHFTQWVKDKAGAVSADISSTHPSNAPTALSNDVKAPNGAPQTFADLAELLTPAVVNVSSTIKIKQPTTPEGLRGTPFEQLFKDFMDRNGLHPPTESTPMPEDGEQNPFGEDMPNQDGMGPEETSLGSGFIIDAAKGYVVTNNHVIKDAEEVRITLHDDTTLDAKILAKDEKTDLALLQVEPNPKLKAVPFGNSDSMRVGDWVLTIGNPFGLGGTVTSGIISARQRNINAGPYDDFLQTDASINRGNSGGPMFNLKGEVIGINTAIFSPSGGSVGIGFAIPSNLAKNVIDQLIKFGKTRRGWLGIRIQTVTPEIAETLNLPNPHGALVASITAGGPAVKAGLKAGDVVLAFNGQELNAMHQLPRLVAETEIGSTATLKIWRNGKIIETKIEVGELEKAEEEGKLSLNDEPKTKKGGTTSKIAEKLGFQFSTLTPALRDNFEIPANAKGVVVTSVNPSSQAAEQSLTEGDVIVEINQTPITDEDGAEKALEAAQKSGKKSVLLLVDYQGKGDVRFVAIRLK